MMTGNGNGNNGGETTPTPLPTFITTTSNVEYFADIVNDANDVTASSRAGRVTYSFSPADSSATPPTLATLNFGVAGAEVEYEFTQTANDDGRVISNNNQLLVLRNAETTSAFVTFFTGTNLGETSGQTITSVDIAALPLALNMRTLTTYIDTIDTGTTAEVNYDGEYIIAEVPTNNNFDSAIHRGTFEITVDYENHGPVDTNMMAITGTATDRQNATSGTFSQGRVSSLIGTNTSFSNLQFVGSGSLSKFSGSDGTITLSGSIIGDEANEIVAAGRTASSTFNSQHAVMGIVGAKQ